MYVLDGDGLGGAQPALGDVLCPPGAAPGNCVVGEVFRGVGGPGSTSTASIVAYHRDWDDETTADVGASTLPHAYGWSRTFQVHLAITDSAGHIGRLTRAVVVPWLRATCRSRPWSNRAFTGSPMRRRSSSKMLRMEHTNDRERNAHLDVENGPQ